MFGIRNFTGYSFMAKVTNGAIEFTFGMIEEITCNVTQSAAANAAEIPENINGTFISKDKFISSTSALVASKVAQIKLVDGIDLIAGATPNLLI